MDIEIGFVKPCLLHGEMLKAALTEVGSLGLPQLM